MLKPKAHPCGAFVDVTLFKLPALLFTEPLYLFDILPRRLHVECLGKLSYLVDDIGLEPMTFRTSSGCSSQLS